MDRPGTVFASRSGAAHKAITLDLMLRTFMNSPDFQPQNPRMWEGIARLVPGTTAQQCVQRWEELRSSSRIITRDLSLLSARGKPISPHNDPLQTSRRNTTPSMKSPYIGERYKFTSMSSTELPPILPSESHPSTGRDPIYDQYRGSVSQYRMDNGGQFTASFCQSHIYGTKKKDEEEYYEEEGDQSNTKANNIEQECSSNDTEVTNDRCIDNNVMTPTVNATVSASLLTSPFSEKTDNVQNIMSIHVKDETKKVNKDFLCPRHILIKEMRYFDDYLSSSDSGQWEEVDISVHCDVPVFHWLMSYAKRGMKEGPSGELLDAPLEPPKLEPVSAVPILISSDFLKMDSLVEECIDYCCEHMSDVVSSPSNMACIGDHLLVRMTQKLTPLEIEKVKDPKDKIKSKLYMYMLERMCSSSYSQPQCPVNGSTLFRCKHCGWLLTKEQQVVFPCSNHRLKVDRNGGLIHQHESETAWDINKYISGLRKNKGLQWREIFWRIWGVINWFYCSVCDEPVQCRSIGSCAYHPGIPVSITTSDSNVSSNERYSCCNEPLSSFSPLLATKKGCCYRDHTIGSLSEDNATVLLLMKDLLASISDENSIEQSRISLSCLFSDGHKRRHPAILLESAGAVLKPQRTVRRPYSTSASSSMRTLPEVRDETKLSNKNMSLKKHKMRRATLEDEESTSEESTSSSSSELEEDEEEEKSRQKLKMSQKSSQKKVHVHTMAQLKKPKSVLRSRSSERSMAGWEWDCGKSVRWNQDMQRDDDERKLVSLKQQLQKLTTNERDTKFSKSFDTYNGGIFCLIEAQFRTQRMVANGLGPRQSGHRSLRKNNNSSRF